MKQQNRGFGLIELLIALALGLIVVLGVVQIFIAAKNTYVSQNTAAAMQEDARFVLSKMIQEIRMVGMFGCLGSITDSSSAGDFAVSQITPINWDNASLKLTLVTADIGSNGGTPTWTVISDCRNSATAYTGLRTPASGQIAFPIRRLIYSLSNNQILMGTGRGTPAQQVLVNNVSAFNVTFRSGQFRDRCGGLDLQRQPRRSGAHSQRAPEPDPHRSEQSGAQSNLQRGCRLAQPLASEGRSDEAFSPQPSGAARHGLLVSLVFLLLLTLIGLSSMQSANLQEKMAGSVSVRNQSFQTAEAALRIGESAVQLDSYSLAVCSNTTQCAPPAESSWSARRGSIRLPG
jgi:type IV pilus assembly protein PilW